MIWRNSELSSCSQGSTPKILEIPSHLSFVNSSSPHLHISFLTELLNYLRNVVSKSIFIFMFKSSVNAWNFEYLVSRRLKWPGRLIFHLCLWNYWMKFVLGYGFTLWRDFLTTFTFFANYATTFLAGTTTSKRGRPFHSLLGITAILHSGATSAPFASQHRRLQSPIATANCSTKVVIPRRSRR